MGMYEVAINYVRRLARPSPPAPRTTDASAEAQRPMRRRSRVRRAVKTAHSRVMTRLKQPPPTGRGR